MDIKLDELEKAAVYKLMTQSIIPRPVAWVLSKHETGSLNLAPFSYFSPVSSTPPLLMISAGRKPDGSYKDTKNNIEDNDHFVVHIAHVGQADDMTKTSNNIAPHESEVKLIEAETTEFEGFPLPRLKDAPIALGCKRHTIVTMGEGPQAVIFGEITHAYVRDDLVGEKNKIDMRKLNPISRLGGNFYAELGEFHPVIKPK